MAADLQIRLLGGIRLTQNDIPLTNFVSNKAPALLAYLAVTGRPHQREALAALFWGELADADAKNNLRQTLSSLRRHLEPYLLITRDTVALNPDLPCFLDTAIFEQSLHAGDGLPVETRAMRLQEAVALYQGDFLAGFVVRDAPEFEDWMLAQRSRLRELALYAFHTLTQFHLAHGDPARAIDTAARLLGIDSWREEAHRQLMLALARSGQRSAALAQYETCRRILEKELGVEPSAETTELYERLRAAQRVARHNLPGSTTAFVGRENELAELRRRLSDPACRLVTLTGPGGIGKTRLALQTAAAHADAFINGVWFSPLTAASAESLIYDLADAAQVSIGPGDPKKQLLNSLRAKELLMVLDNFEHLLEAAPLLSEILQRAPDMKLLVTSRERLNLQSEWVFELAGLDLPPGGEAASQAYSAVQLFLHCAQRQHAGFRLAEREWAGVQKICRMLDGLPLGIELAATHARTMDCVAIADEISLGMDFLATTQRDVPERQRSLRAVVESSWRHLTEAERAVFARLAVFRGSFAAPAAEQVAGATPPLLSALVDKSLVRQSGGRFELHEVLRRFAGEYASAQPAEYEMLEAGHGAYYARWLAEVHQQATQPNGENIALAATAAEFGNLRAAWHWAAAHGRVPQLTQLFPGMYRFMDVRGYYREGAEVFAQAADALGPELQATDEQGRLTARLVVGRAMCLLHLGQAEAAVKLFEAGLSFFRRVDDPPQLVRCLNGLGTAAYATGQYERARPYYSEQVQVARVHGLQAETATALNNLGNMSASTGDYSEAIRLHRECLALRRTLGDRIGIASSLINLNVALTNSGDYSHSEQLLKEALAISREFNDARRTGAVLTNLGAVARRAGRLEEERSYYEQALAVHRESGHQLGIALALNNLGSVTCRLGDLAEARRYLRATFTEALAGNFDFVTLDALLCAALLLSKEGQKTRALELLALPLHHPAADGETVEAARAALADISAGQDASAVAAALEQGNSQGPAEAARAVLAKELLDV